MQLKIGYLMQSGAPDIRFPPYSGPSNHTRQVIQNLQGLGHQVRLVAQQGGQIVKSDDLETFAAVSLSGRFQRAAALGESGIRRVQSSLRLPYADYFDSQRFGRACVQELNGVQILYERMGWFGYGGMFAARKLAVPRVLEINGDHLSELEHLGMAPRGMQRWLSVHLMRMNIRQVSAFVAAGEGWGQRFIERWATPADKMVVIENGSEVVNLLRREQLRCFQVEAPQADPLELVFVGGFDPWQGVGILIEAFAQVVQQGVPAHLTLIGSGAALPELKQQVIKQQVEQRVTFMGWLPTCEMAECLASADIGVSPYCGRVEFSGLKLLDYKAAGLAVIASGQNAQPKVLAHGQSGWIVPPCDVQALSHAILQLSGDPLLRKQLGRTARIEAEKSHTWRSTAQSLEQLFSKVVPQ